MRQINYIKVMAIVHGQSEYIICRSIKSNLRIKHQIISREKGKTSIQITSVLSILNDARFKTYNSFIRFFNDIERLKRKLVNFRLFIIMDVDDCTEEEKKLFINKEMFSDHWLYDYIIPIYSDPKLERTMHEASIEINDKGDYFTIFPTNHGDLDMEKAKEYRDKLKQCTCSNLYEYFDYCIAIAEEKTIRS